MRHVGVQTPAIRVAPTFRGAEEKKAADPQAGHGHSDRWKTVVQSLRRGTPLSTALNLAATLPGSSRVV